jgi:hypothetical protein
MAFRQEVENAGGAPSRAMPRSGFENLRRGAVVHSAATRTPSRRKTFWGAGA